MAYNFFFHRQWRRGVRRRWRRRTWRSSWSLTRRWWTSRWCWRRRGSRASTSPTRASTSAYRCTCWTSSPGWGTCSRHEEQDKTWALWWGCGHDVCLLLCCKKTLMQCCLFLKKAWTCSSHDDQVKPWLPWFMFVIIKPKQTKKYRVCLVWASLNTGMMREQTHSLHDEQAKTWALMFV